MTENNDNNDDSGIFLSTTLKFSRSLSEISYSNNNPDNIMSSGSSSMDEIYHTEAVKKIRRQTLGTLTRIYPNESPSSGIISNDESEHSVECIKQQSEVVSDASCLYSEDFRHFDTHIFILSKSGKPIFSRYGTDTQITSLFGVMQALVSFVENSDDKLKVVTSGNHNFVFQIYEDMILVGVTKYSYVPNQLRIILGYLYYQILSILTLRTISKAFTKHPGLDLRRLLIGTDRFLNGFIDYMEMNMGPLLNSVFCVPMQYSLRQELLNTISQNSKVNELVFAILLLDEKIVGVIRRKEHQPHPVDIHVILNLIRNSSYFKTQISWLPICLPKFDPDGFFYAYISYLFGSLSLVLLTVNPEQFDELHQCRWTIYESMKSRGLFNKLNSIYTIDDFIQSYKLSEVSHFFYKMRNANQCISYCSKEVCDEKEIISKYLRLHHFIHSPTKSITFVYQFSDSQTCLARQTHNFELYACLKEVNTKGKAVEILNKLIDAINSQKHRLFITFSPTF